MNLIRKELSNQGDTVLLGYYVSGYWDKLLIVTVFAHLRGQNGNLILQSHRLLYHSLIVTIFSGLNSVTTTKKDCTMNSVDAVKRFIAIMTGNFHVQWSAVVLTFRRLPSRKVRHETEGAFLCWASAEHAAASGQSGDRECHSKWWQARVKVWSWGVPKVSRRWCLTRQIYYLGTPPLPRLNKWTRRIHYAETFTQWLFCPQLMTQIVTAHFRLCEMRVRESKCPLVCFCSQ